MASYPSDQQLLKIFPALYGNWVFVLMVIINWHIFLFRSIIM